MIGNKKGNDGENIAAAFLEENGYTVKVKNYRNIFGEIDIVAEKGEHIVFVEVKLRKENPRVSGLESVTLSKQRKIIKTSFLFLQDHHISLQPRYDVISITDLGDGKYKTEHIKSAFDTQNLFY